MNHYPHKMLCTKDSKKLKVYIYSNDITHYELTLVHRKKNDWTIKSWTTTIDGKTYEFYSNTDWLGTVEYHTNWHKYRIGFLELENYERLKFDLEYLRKASMGQKQVKVDKVDKVEEWLDARRNAVDSKECGRQQGMR